MTPGFIEVLLLFAFLPAWIGILFQLYLALSS